MRKIDKLNEHKARYRCKSGHLYRAFIVWCCCFDCIEFGKMAEAFISGLPCQIHQ